MRELLLVGIGLLWVGKEERFDGLLLYIYFGWFGRTYIIGRLITKSFLFKDLSIFFFVMGVV